MIKLALWFWCISLEVFVKYLNACAAAKEQLKAHLKWSLNTPACLVLH